MKAGPFSLEKRSGSLVSWVETSQLGKRAGGDAASEGRDEGEPEGVRAGGGRELRAGAHQVPADTAGGAEGGREREGDDGRGAGVAGGGLRFARPALELPVVAGVELAPRVEASGGLDDPVDQRRSRSGPEADRHGVAGGRAARGRGVRGAHDRRLRRVRAGTVGQDGLVHPPAVADGDVPLALRAAVAGHDEVLVGAQNGHEGIVSFDREDVVAMNGEVLDLLGVGRRRRRHGLLDGLVAAQLREATLEGRASLTTGAGDETRQERTALGTRRVPLSAERDEQPLASHRHQQLS